MALFKCGGGGGAIKKLIAEFLTKNGVTTASNAKDDAIITNVGTYGTNKYNTGYTEGKTAGASSVTLSSAVSGRTVTTTASNGKTSSASIALGTGSGSTTFTLTPTGNNTATKAMAAGYYNAGTITANGATAYAAGVTAGKNAAKSVVGNYTFTATGSGTYKRAGYCNTGVTGKTGAALINVVSGLNIRYSSEDDGSATLSASNGIILTYNSSTGRVDFTSSLPWDSNYQFANSGTATCVLKIVIYA